MWHKSPLFLDWYNRSSFNDTSPNTQIVSCSYLVIYSFFSSFISLTLSSDSYSITISLSYCVLSHSYNVFPSLSRIRYFHISLLSTYSSSSSSSSFPSLYSVHWWVHRHCVNALIPSFLLQSPVFVWSSWPYRKPWQSRCFSISQSHRNHSQSKFHLCVMVRVS